LYRAQKEFFETEILGSVVKSQQGGWGYGKASFYFFDFSMGIMGLVNRSFCQGGKLVFFFWEKTFVGYDLTDATQMAAVLPAPKKKNTVKRVKGQCGPKLTVIQPLGPHQPDSKNGTYFGPPQKTKKRWGSF